MSQPALRIVVSKMKTRSTSSKRIVNGDISDFAKENAIGTFVPGMAYG